MFHALSTGFSYYVIGPFQSNQAEESSASQNTFVNPLYGKRKPLKAKVVAQDKLTDYATSDAFLWHLPTRIVGVKLENDTVRYAVFDHKSNNLLQESLSPKDVKATSRQFNAIRDTYCPHLDSTTNEVYFRPFVGHTGRVWWDQEIRAELIKSDNQFVWKITDTFHKVIHFIPLEKGVLLEDYNHPDKAAHPITPEQIDTIERFELERLTVTKNKIEELVFIHVPWKSHFNPKLELTPERGAVTLVNTGSSTGCGPNLVGHAMLVMEYVEGNRYYLQFAHILKGGTKDCFSGVAKQMVEIASMVEQKSAEATQIKKPPKGIPAVIERRIRRNPSQLRYYKKGPTVPASIEKLNFMVATIIKEQEAYNKGNPIVFFDMFHPDRDKVNCSKWAYDKALDAGIEYSPTALTKFATALDKIGGGHTYFRKSNWVRYSVVHGHMLDLLAPIRGILLRVGMIPAQAGHGSRKALTASKEASARAKESSVTLAKKIPSC